MTKVIAIANQKGGVTKTTTTLHLGFGLAKLGKKVLFVDTDHQNGLSVWLGVENVKENPNYGFSNVIAKLVVGEDGEVEKAIHHHYYNENIDFIPNNIAGAQTETLLTNARNRDFIFARCLEDVKDNYDYILLDCPGNLGQITLTAMATADSVIMAAVPDEISVLGVQEMMKSVLLTKKLVNPKLEMDGIILARCDLNTNYHKEVIAAMRSNYGLGVKIYESLVPRAIKVTESFSARMSIFEYAPKSNGAIAYENVVNEFLEMEKLKQKQKKSKSKNERDER